MTKVRVHNFAISLDGFGAGPDQTLEEPLGVGGESLHDWFVTTETFKKVQGMEEGGTTGPDDDMAARMLGGIGASIMGRNMFGPVRGEWPDETWTGWWGDNPPYHHPVFVLTHHERRPLEMEGGTTFYFVTDGIESAFEQAVAAAGDQDVQINGGASTIRQFLERRLITDMHVAISPIVLGRGEPLFAGLDLKALGYECVEFNGSPTAAHALFERRG
jgi:dihydrofolate reductase